MASKSVLVSVALSVLVAAVLLCGSADAGVPLVGYGGNTFNEIFSTGFQNGLGGYGAGTVAGAVGYYGQFTGIGQVGVGQTLSAKGGHYGRR